MGLIYNSYQADMQAKCYNMSNMPNINNTNPYTAATTVHYKIYNISNIVHHGTTMMSGLHSAKFNIYNIDKILYHLQQSTTTSTT